MTSDINFFDPNKEADAKRRRMMAQQLTQNSSTNGTQMVGGIAIQKSPLEHLTGALRQGIGAYQSSKADQIDADLQASRQKAIANAILGGDAKEGAAALLQHPETMAMGAKMYAQAMGGNSPTGGSTGELAKMLIDEDNGIESYQDALRFMKGGAGSYGKLNNEIEFGRQAEFEKKFGSQTAIQQTASDIEKQKIIGKEEGDAQASLNAQTASYPKLEEVVDRLGTLGKEASYTLAGRGIDTVARQLGHTTDGAEARAEYIATVDNEILPLLRQTFGAAFTQKEGESLKATLGAANASPEEKDAVLRAFIRQKQTQLEALQRQTGSPVTGAPTNKRSRLEELRAKHGR